MTDQFPNPETSSGLSTVCESCGGEGCVEVLEGYSGVEPIFGPAPCPDCSDDPDGRDYEGEVYWQQQYEEHRYD